MKHSRFSEEQIISILHGAEQGDQTIGAVRLNQTVLAYGIAQVFQNANCC